MINFIFFSSRINDKGEFSTLEFRQLLHHPIFVRQCKTFSCAEDSWQFPDQKSVFNLSILHLTHYMYLLQSFHICKNLYIYLYIMSIKCLMMFYYILQINEKHAQQISYSTIATKNCIRVRNYPRYRWAIFQWLLQSWSLKGH